MKLYFNVNPGRGWFWWHVSESSDAAPLVNGRVLDSVVECVGSALTHIAHAARLGVKFEIEPTPFVAVAGGLSGPEVQASFEKYCTEFREALKEED